MVSALSLLALVAFPVAPCFATQNWSSPAHYPGKPNTTYSVQWQKYFEVTEPLENVTFSVPHSYAGSISTNTPGQNNNSAFFWAFEKTNGSLIANKTDDPWMLWLAGGPGFSSIAAGLVENIGPIVVNEQGGLSENKYSWHNLADMFFVDAPVGVGYATVGRGGYPDSEDKVAQDFLGFLSNLVKVFPALKTRPLHLVGESYAGRFIPYILKNYFAMPANDRPVKFGKIGANNPALTNANLFENMPVSRVVETYPQLIGYDTKVYDYLREQYHLCEFDVNLTYPQAKPIPHVAVEKGAIATRLPRPTGNVNALGVAPPSKPFMQDLAERYAALPEDTKRMAPEVREERRRAWVRENIDRDLSVLEGRDEDGKSSSSSSASATPTIAPPKPFNSTQTGKINEWWGCDMRDLVLTYALNFTFPWNAMNYSFDYLDIPYTVNPVTVKLHPHHWMNHNTTRAALHAPRNKIWRVTDPIYPWNNDPLGSDTSPPPMTFMNELAANATKENIGMVWYSGNDDALSTHWSTEVCIQNSTWGGEQGFTVKPNTSWYDDDGLWAGVVRQERGWTYGLLYGAGHQTPVINPGRTYSFIQQFFIGDSKTGLVDKDGTVHTTAQPPSATFVPDILPDGVVTGQAGIYFGSSTVLWPQATMDSWKAHISSVFYDKPAPTTTTKASSSSPSTTSTKSSKASSAAKTSTASKTDGASASAAPPTAAPPTAAPHARRHARDYSA